VRRLKAGRYRATIVAISRSGRHSKRHVITFRVTR